MDNKCKKMTPEQEAAMENALLQSHIVETIVLSMDFPELKACRLVNSYWKKLVTARIRQLNCCAIEFESERKVPKPEEPSKKIQDFQPILETCSAKEIFPCTQFTISDNVGSTIVQDFLKIHGPHIKTLTLPACAGKEQDFVQFFQLLPNLETLDITGDLSFDDFEIPENVKLFLPSLKSFTWMSASGLAKKILEDAEKLEIIPNFYLAWTDWDVLKESKKVSLVHEYDCDTKYLQDFCYTEPTLRKIVSFNYEHLASHTKRFFEFILESSKDTLEFLFWTNLVSLLRCPKSLPNLKTLALGARPLRPMFPSGVNFASTFPNVRVLDTSSMGTHEDKRWTAFFPAKQVKSLGLFPSVKVLRTDQECTELWMTKLQDLCPNFDKLVLTSYRSASCKEHNLSKIFKMWPHLVSLELRVMTDSFDKYWMDSELTGLSKMICNRLRDLEEMSGQVKEEEANMPSISDLKGLTRLTVTFRGKLLTPFSKVAGILSIRKLPNLKVVIQFDQAQFKNDNCGFVSLYNDVVPFANIRHLHPQMLQYNC